MRYCLILISQLFALHFSLAQTSCPHADELIDTSTPDVIVGNGSPASCTSAAFQSAFDQGGIITCNCGPNPISVNLASELTVSVDVVFDGGELITFNGNDATRIIHKSGTADLTVQNTRFINGLSPSNLSLHFSRRCGGAILTRGGGTFTAINCDFEDNSVSNLDESDIAGGAVYVFGETAGRFTGCSFDSNWGCNGGAIGGLGSDVYISNCDFINNVAAGTSGGLRGHGGAINLDGVELAAADKTYTVCGSNFIGNNAETQGGASNTVFSDNEGTKLEMDQCYFENNYLRSSNSGNGGAIFHYVDEIDGGTHELQFEITRSSFIKNHCNRQGGAIWAGIVGEGIIENCSFYGDSTASINHGLGGAVIIGTNIDNQGLWTIRNNTFARNYAGLFGGALFADPTGPVYWQNNILFDNYHSNTNPWVGLNVNRTMDIDGGGNIQWPQFRPNGSQDNQATPTVSFTDPLLMMPPVMLGGPTPSIGLQENSPAIDFGNGSNCPSFDQRLATRTNCDCGSFEYAALPLPMNIHVTGLQLTDSSYIAMNAVTSDADIQTGAEIIFSAGQIIELFAGFEVELGSALMCMIW